jgi:hypothetical protein
MGEGRWLHISVRRFSRRRRALGQTFSLDRAPGAPLREASEPKLHIGSAPPSRPLSQQRRHFQRLPPPPAKRSEGRDGHSAGTWCTRDRSRRSSTRAPYGNTCWNARSRCGPVGSGRRKGAFLCTPGLGKQSSGSPHSNPSAYHGGKCHSLRTLCTSTCSCCGRRSHPLRTLCTSTCSCRGSTSCRASS